MGDSPCGTRLICGNAFVNGFKTQTIHVVRHFCPTSFTMDKTNGFAIDMVYSSAEYFFGGLRHN